MRVLFLTLYPDAAASPRYRVGQFVPRLEAFGIHCTVTPAVGDAVYGSGVRPSRYHLHEISRRIRQLLLCRRYDAVFLQKCLMSAYIRGLDRLLAACAPKLVYDIDDAVHLAPPHPLRRPWSSVEDPHQVEKLIARADLVLAGNHWLAAEARAQGGNAVFFPTVVDTARFVPGNARDSVYRVGWIGNPSTTPHLDAAAEALRDLRDAEVHLVGADPKRVPCPDAWICPWNWASEVQEVQRFSVGIMPLPKTAWARGKCALKSLQYMACGVPCIATPFGAVLDIIRHGENGLLAGSADEWRACLAQLRDPALRRRLGEAGRATVEEQFSLDKAAPKLAALLEGVR